MNSGQAYSGRDTELAALAYGMFMRPGGAWGMAPLMVVVSPTLTALSVGAT